MKAVHIGITTVVLFSVAGCSSVGLGSKRIDYRSGATQAPSLEVPPDLISPRADPRFSVPGGEGGSVATYSGYSKGGAGEYRAAGSGVLPEIKGVRLERSGTQRWLVVGSQPDAVWAVVKAFFQENGLSIKTEDEAAGVMETEWAENRADIPQGVIRSVLGKVFDNAYSSGMQDQYRARLERSGDGASTEVYITHRGMEEVLDASGNTSKWQPRANDPELEAIMLQKLMVRLGAGEAQASGALAGGAASAGGDGRAVLRQTSGGGSIIVISDAFDRSWRRVGLAIERAGLVVEDKDRDRGVYFLTQGKTEKSWMDTLMFWKDDKSGDGRYRVTLRSSGAVCEVSVSHRDGASDDVTRRITEAIYQHIEP